MSQEHGKPAEETPESWETHDEKIQTSSFSFNIDSKPFEFNIGASDFTPSFAPPPSSGMESSNTMLASAYSNPTDYGYGGYQYNQSYQEQVDPSSYQTPEQYREDYEYYNSIGQAQGMWHPRDYEEWYRENIGYEDQYPGFEGSGEFRMPSDQRQQSRKNQKSDKKATEGFYGQKQVNPNIKKKAQPPKLPPKESEEKKIKKRKEKPKEKVVEPAIDKAALLAKLREQPEQQNEELKLYEPDPAREPVNIVFIGHVDAGKSTICGNILLISGKVDRRLVEQYQNEAKEQNRESWWLAYFLDINEDERQRGKTVEVGRAFFETASRRYTILDAPGHKDYVPNMIAGACQADYSALVISARTGEFETGFEKAGQTREHALLARSLGSNCLIILVNKMDSVDWSEERFNQIKNDLIPFIRDTCKWNIENEVYFIPISGLHGHNLQERVPAESCPWYTGPTLFEVLNTLPIPNRTDSSALRMPILDRYKEIGLSIFGKVESGTLIKGQKITVMPNALKAEVSEIYGAEDVKMMFAKPGDNIRIKLKTSDDVDIQRGYMICDVHDLCHYAQEFEADIQFLELVDHKPLVTAGYECIIHIHTAIEECTITEMITMFDPVKKKKVKCSFGRSGSRFIARVRTRNPICVEAFKDVPQLGRFTLRDENKTIGLGRVTKIENPASEQALVEELGI